MSHRDPLAIRHDHLEIPRDIFSTTVIDAKYAMAYLMVLKNWRVTGPQPWLTAATKADCGRGDLVEELSHTNTASK